MVRAGRWTGAPEVVRLSIIKQQFYESISKRRRLRRFESRLARGFRGKEESFSISGTGAEQDCPPHLLQQQPAHAVEHAEGSHESWHERHRARR